MESHHEQTSHRHTPVSTHIPRVKAYRIEMPRLGHKRIGRELHNSFTWQNWMMMGVEVVNHNNL